MTNKSDLIEARSEWLNRTFGICNLVTRHWSLVTQ